MLLWEHFLKCPMVKLKSRSMYFKWTFDIQQLDYTEWKPQWQSQINFLQPAKWTFRRLCGHFQTCLPVHITWQVGERLLEFPAIGRLGRRPLSLSHLLSRPGPATASPRDQQRTEGLFYTFIVSGLFTALISYDSKWEYAAAFGKTTKTGIWEIMAMPVFWEPNSGSC